MQSEKKLQYQSTLKTTTIIPRPGPVSACWLYSTGRRELIHPKFWNQFHVFRWKKRNWFPPIIRSIDRIISILSSNHTTAKIFIVSELQRIIYAMPRTQSSYSATNSKQQVCTLSHRLANVFSNVKSKRSKVSTWRFSEPCNNLAPRSRFEKPCVCNIAS